jgi:hypothetical protein
MNRSDRFHARHGLAFTTKAYWIMAASLLTLAIVTGFSGGNVWGSFGLGMAAGCYATMPFTVRSAYRSGWYRARGQMLDAIAEAVRRRMSFIDFLNSEQEREP